VLDLLHGLSRKREMAVLLVTHDPQARAYADRVHELRDGRLQAYIPDQDPEAAEPSGPGA
jgi:ABC-type lipoprotein export system ATPase subunit